MKGRDLRDVSPQGEDNENVFFYFVHFCSQVSSFKGGMSLTLCSFL